MSTFQPSASDNSMGSSSPISLEPRARGVYSVLAASLHTRAGDSVLVFCDETTQSTAQYFLDIGTRILSAKVKILCVPAPEQRLFSQPKPRNLPASLRSAIDDASRVVFLQHPSADVQAFRLSVLQYCETNHARRAASMPGVTESTLHLCCGDLDEIARRCSLIADLLVRARCANLLTHTINGLPLELEIPLGTYKPTMSTGDIASGSWGNVPSGETFVVPNVFGARGEVSIRGSILGYPMGTAEEIVLTFEKGRAIPFPLCRGKMKPKLAGILFSPDGREVFKDCSVLGELGIGANSDINELTGLSLFDEKILGTAHLGLGASHQFGGPIACAVHNDYVATGATLRIHDTLLVRDGHFVLSADDVYPNWRSLPRQRVAGRLLFGRGAENYAKRDGLLYLKWLSPRSNRENLTQVGDSETSHIAFDIIERIEALPEPFTVDDIRRGLTVATPTAAVTTTLGLLVSFGILRQQ